jgi:hypothetical protein
MLTTSIEHKCKLSVQLLTSNVVRRNIVYATTDVVLCVVECDEEFLVHCKHAGLLLAAFDTSDITCVVHFCCTVRRYRYVLIVCVCCDTCNIRLGRYSIYVRFQHRGIGK